MPTVTIRKIIPPAEKSALCNAILRALPNWFGIEASIVEYVAEVEELPFFAALLEGEAVGFAALKPHNPHTSEVCVMGVLDGHHRHGIGRRLIERCEGHAIAQGNTFLTVKTLAGSHPDPYYARTRQFYQAVGFRPLEVFPTLWDEHNPCLFMAKHLPTGG